MSKFINFEWSQSPKSVDGEVGNWLQHRNNFDVNIFHCAIESKLFIADSITRPSVGLFRFFSTASQVRYYPLCDDFGPMNISCVVRFIELLHEQFRLFPTHSIIYVVDKGRRPLTNGIFLIGCYMMLIDRMEPEEVMSRFDDLEEELLPFRDASYFPPDFALTLEDCWRAIKRALMLKWLEVPSHLGISAGGTWGMIDIDQYDELEDPLFGDLVEVVPGKFVAFRGPKDLKGLHYLDRDGFREFSPLFYRKIFAHLKVEAIVRLNEALYDKARFEEVGMAHYDLTFEDCTSPHENIVEAFLSIADKTPGVVAVHCKAGLGRTGSLIARYLMRTHQFTAREAIAWLRIMRPGSVLGEQQQYLCDVEALAIASHARKNNKANSSAVFTAAPKVQLTKARSVAVSGFKASLDSIRRLATGKPDLDCQNRAALASQVSTAVERRAAVSRRQTLGFKELPPRSSPPTDAVATDPNKSETTDKNELVKGGKAGTSTGQLRRTCSNSSSESNHQCSPTTSTAANQNTANAISAPQPTSPPKPAGASHLEAKAETRPTATAAAGLLRTAKSFFSRTAVDQVRPVSNSKRNKAPVQSTLLPRKDSKPAGSRDVQHLAPLRPPSRLGMASLHSAVSAAARSAHVDTPRSGGKDYSCTRRDALPSKNNPLDKEKIGTERIDRNNSMGYDSCTGSSGVKNGICRPLSSHRCPPLSRAASTPPEHTTSLPSPSNLNSETDSSSESSPGHLPMHSPHAAGTGSLATLAALSHPTSPGRAASTGSLLPPRPAFNNSDAQHVIPAGGEIVSGGDMDKQANRGWRPFARVPSTGRLKGFWALGWSGADGGKNRGLSMDVDRKAKGDHLAPGRDLEKCDADGSDGEGTGLLPAERGSI